ncbi:MAG: TIGR00282 family metallophosphoesterase [Candidatus Latescibacteria bacterium]|nr:TIGR00282 family metallophosphoesterase [Candidatus Latescibacterota bacterium]NIM21522.1 TIGR00282 family metallophosphoesterase [Candidatus Latescibacterota bacterium]NIM65693.1 TIGR00282 family metallophosphoesterase [Candidatus Latescibacterota bacterium]NIO02075.1 TIGR00282 family metallophosphoesterase [Candidatus Latescibacterota bacterium]NIO28887.1 TIGR00282 family metallophosphoesterase [Candidatus Latescibacterota bacterium]
MRIAFIGDVVGKSGRRAVAELFSPLKKQRKIDFTIANVENVAGGFGIVPKAIDELQAAGVDFFTSGNHVWDNREGVPMLDERANIIRPANYPGASPGTGWRIVEVTGHPIAVINVQGRVFMPPIDCPFRTVDRVLSEIGEKSRITIVDVHGEATSEKVAMGWYLDGRASLVIGTHTHVPTKDCRVFPRGTGYVTDVGMSGAYDSILGVDKKAVLQRFMEMRPCKFQVARGDIRCDLVIADIDPTTGKLVEFEHLQLKQEA